jgi:hypothetical protein
MTCEPLQPFRRVRDILRNVLAMHLHSIDQYEAALPQSHDPRHRAVLSYLRDSELLLAAAVRRYELGGDEVLETMIQSVPCASLTTAANLGTANGDIERLLADYRERNAALRQLYEQLEASVGPRAQTILADFADLERRSQERLQHALLDF